MKMGTISANTANLNIKMNVLQIGKYLPPPYAGIEAHVHDLMVALRPDVSSTLVAATTDPSHPLRNQLAPYRVSAAHCYGAVASVPLAPGMYFNAARAVDRGEVDILHTHAPNPWGDLLAIRYRRSLPVVMTWHSDIVRQRRLMKLYGPIQRAALSASRCIMIPTPKHYESSSQLKSVDVEKKIRIVPFGIDFDGLDRVPDTPLPEDLQKRIAGRQIALTIGRHVSYKGYDNLVAAFQKVDESAVLLFVGDGPLTASLKLAVAERKLEQRILFLGRVEQELLVNLIRRSSVFCLPSVTQAEAFGLATAEAMSLGCPAIVCDLANGVNYLNRPDHTGLTVQVGDVPALGAAIDALIRNPVLAKKLGAQAREWVRSEFSPSAMKAATLRVYDEVRNG